MSRTAYKFSAAIVSCLLAGMLAGCGSDHREGNANAGNVARVADEATCRVCHSTTIDPRSATALLPEYFVSVHNPSGPNAGVNLSTDPDKQTGCQGCHGGGAQHNGVGPIPYPDPLNIKAADGSTTTRCVFCHTNVPATDLVRNFPVNCNPCHNPANPTAGLHAAQAIASDSCIDCHDIKVLQHGPNLLNDNSGVRNIMPEFAKRSHHITGAAPTNAQCAVCHLEAAPDGAGGIKINDNFHMKDAKVHLRDVDHAGAEFAWDGIDHSAMDNFCFACHDSDGASDLTTLHALIPAATAGNPFNDTLTNGYDQVARNGVVDVKTAFTTTNASHHAVSGQRYTYRFSTAANAAAWAARTGKAMPDASQIAEGHTVNGAVVHFDAAETMTGDYTPGSATPGEGESTLYEAGKFVATYIPLGASQNVADNSTLHCGDCHTVGQWKSGASTNADGSSTTVAIGAHGSANEYLLRNSLGTDALHSSQTYVCFNCHATGVLVANSALFAANQATGKIAATAIAPTWRAGWNALHPNVMAAQVWGYATAHAVSAFHAQCIADSSAQIGTTNRLGIQTGGGNKDRTLDFIPAPGATANAPSTLADSGNITGIGCTSCHNSGLRSSFGGIHGGDNTYVDGLGRSQKSYRFMPGMGNYKYAPPGGWDGQDKTDASLVTMPGAGVGAGKAMGGCYTNSATGDTNPGYSTCSHHGTSTAQTTAGLQAAGGRATYGGGTSSTPTASEPTVREATAGGALVTRPPMY